MSQNGISYGVCILYNRNTFTHISLKGIQKNSSSNNNMFVLCYMQWTKVYLYKFCNSCLESIRIKFICCQFVCLFWRFVSARLDNIITIDVKSGSELESIQIMAHSSQSLQGYIRLQRKSQAHTLSFTVT